MNCLERIFHCSKPMISMAHLPALPGRSLYDDSLGMAHIVDILRRDIDALQKGGVDGILFCNENDLPYGFTMGPAEIAAMASAIGQLKSELSVPFGVNMMWDPIASLAVAKATGGSFVREVFTGSFDSDMGVFNTRPQESFDFRRRIDGGDIAIFNNVSPEFSKSLGGRTIAERASMAEYFRSDAILVSGIAAGTAMPVSHLTEAKGAVKDTPVLANTGVRLNTVEDILSVCDGIIVGTALKVDGDTWNPVDPARVKAMADRVKQLRS